MIEILNCKWMMPTIIYEVLNKKLLFAIHLFHLCANYIFTLTGDDIAMAFQNTI